ncbi:MAG TPA: MFS transporter [Gaiellales bacterium]|jgi:MFS transporter|nr:MFS transporter [Gaiellales bacterium]
MRLGRRFFAAAGLSGMAFGVLAVAVPMHVAALHRPASVAGQLLASVTIAVALGALAAGPLGRLVGSARNVLAVSMAVSAAGQLVLLAVAETTPMLAGTVLVGLGIGLFWVSSQTLLGKASGSKGSERNFAYHYAAYTLGVAGGSALAGVAVGVLRSAGADETLAVRMSYAVGAAATLAALGLWRPERYRREDVPRQVHPRVAAGGVAMQLPDLLLVAALALMLPLAPLVLVRQFHLAPLVVGLTFAAVQGGKVAGTLAGRITCREHGHRVAILALLAAGAVLSLLLSISTDVLGAPLFIAVLIATAFVTTGAWPLIVDSALARTAPADRPGATVTWNVCEYGVIAVMTAMSGWLLASFHRPALLFTLGAAFLAASAAAAAVVLLRPVYTPDVQ